MNKEKEILYKYTLGSVNTENKKEVKKESKMKTIKTLLTENFDYCSTQFDLKLYDKKDMKELFKDFFDEGDVIEDMEGGNIFTEPHVTLLYGIKNEEDVEKIKKYLYKNPIEIQIGKFQLFSPEQADYDTLVAYIDCPEIVKLHDKLKLNIDNDYNYESYQPHITIAYLKKGTGKKYFMKKNPLEGYEAVVSELTFSHRDGKKTKLKLERKEMKKSELREMIRECIKETLKESKTKKVTKKTEKK